MNILKITLSILLMMTSVSAFSQKSHKIKIFEKGGGVIELAAQDVIRMTGLEKSPAGELTVYTACDTIVLPSTKLDSICYVGKPSVPETLKVLTIGNSFSADAVEQELYGLMKAAGQKIIIGNMYIAGCDLKTHWEKASGNLADYSYRKIVDGEMTTTDNSKLSPVLKDEEWDYISFQEGAGHHGMMDYMEPYLSNLIKYCRDNAAKPDFKIIYHAPWAAQTGCTSSKFANYDYDQAKMYKCIVDVTKELADTHDFDLVINTMDAIQNGRTSFLGDTFNRDGWHLNKTYGRYTASCIWFEKLMGYSVFGNTYHPSTISDTVAMVCQDAAHKAVLYPYETTDLSFYKNDYSENSDKRILAKWRFTPTYAVLDGSIQTWCNQTEPGVYTYSNQPGERGYYLAYGGGSGRLSYVQVDKTKWPDDSGDERAGLSILDAATGGQPVVCGQMPGDYWLFETTGNYELEEGTTLHMSFTLMPGSYGAKYWLLEYLDGNEWEPALPVKEVSIAISGEDITYNVENVAGERHAIEFYAVLEQHTKEFKVRLTCQSEYQVNDKWFNHPRRQSVQRIAGKPSDDNEPVMEEIFTKASSKKRK